MSDRESIFVDRIAAELRTVRWPEPGEIRSRARRRGRRTAVLAALLVMVTVTGVAYGIDRSGVGSGPVPTGSTPDRSELAAPPEAALLSQVDVPAGAELTREAARPLETLSFFHGGLNLCAERKGLPDWEWPGTSQGQYVVSPGAGTNVTPNGMVVHQSVVRVAPETAGRIVADLDRLVAACDGFTIEPATPGRDGGGVTRPVVFRITLSDRDFAGEQAVMLREESTGGVPPVGGTETSQAPGRLVVIRAGDLVTVLEPGDRTTDAELLRLGTLAAHRLCAAAGRPC